MSIYEKGGGCWWSGAMDPDSNSVQNSRPYVSSCFSTAGDYAQCGRHVVL